MTSQIKISITSPSVKSSYNQGKQKRSLNSRNTSLSQQFIYEVLGLQQQFKKYKSKESLTKLIQHYRKLVEFYSEKNDRISIYFMQKISVLSAEVPNMQESDEKLTMSMAREIQQQAQPSVDKRFASAKMSHLNTPVRYDPQMKRRQRSKNAQIAIEVSKIRKRANARSILNSYYEECLQNNVLVANDLQSQRKNLQEKLLAIHQRSLHSAKQFSIVSQSKQIIVFDQNGNIEGDVTQNSRRISSFAKNKQLKLQNDQTKHEIHQNDVKEQERTEQKDQNDIKSIQQEVPILNFSFK